VGTVIGTRLAAAPFLAAAIAVAAALALSGCGSSKPAYCSDRSSLEKSVKDLGSVNLKNGGEVKSQLQKVKSDANAVISSAKGDFPNQTAAIKSSVSALEKAVKGLPQQPSPQQFATLAGDVKNVATSVKGFTDATASKCS
jgi:uncharacterized membrane protein YdfJ with MMPL/SSD domain